MNFELESFINEMDKIAYKALIETITLSIPRLVYSDIEKDYNTSCNFESFLRNVYKKKENLTKKETIDFVSKLIYNLSKSKISLTYNANANGIFSVLYLKSKDYNSYHYNCITGSILEMYTFQKIYKFPMSDLNVELQGTGERTQWTTLPKLVEKSTHWCSNFQKTTTRQSSTLKKINRINIGDKLFLPSMIYQLFSYYKKFANLNLINSPMYFLFMELLNIFYRDTRLIFEDDRASIMKDYQKQIDDEINKPKSAGIENYFALLVTDRIVLEFKECKNINDYKDPITKTLINIFNTQKIKKLDDLYNTFKQTKLYNALVKCLEPEIYSCMTLNKNDCDANICEWSGDWKTFKTRTFNNEYKEFCVPKTIRNDFGTTYDGIIAKKYITDVQDLSGYQQYGGNRNNYYKYKKYKNKYKMLKRIIKDNNENNIYLNR